MRKDSISQDALDKAMLIYAERGHQIEEYDFSHKPTDYYRNTVMEPDANSVIEGAFKELTPGNVMDGFRYEDLEKKAHELNLKIDETQNKLRLCRMRGNFQEFHRCMKDMQNLIKEKEALDAKMSVVPPGGNAGQKQMTDYNRTYEQTSSYSEMEDIGEQIAALQEMMETYLQDAE